MPVVAVGVLLDLGNKLFRDRTDRSVRGLFGFAPQVFADQACDLLIRDCPGTSRLEFVVQPLKTVIQVAFVPEANRLLTESEFFGNRSVCSVVDLRRTTLGGQCLRRGH